MLMCYSVGRRLPFLLCESVLKFECYLGVSSKNHSGCGELVSAKYNLTTTWPHPSCDIVLKSMHSIQQQAKCLTPSIWVLLSLRQWEVERKLINRRR